MPTVKTADVPRTENLKFYSGRNSFETYSMLLLQFDEEVLDRVEVVTRMELEL